MVKVISGKKRANAWYFANLSKPICQQVWEIGNSYYQKIQDPKRRPKHTTGYPVQTIKYFFFLYLTGSRLMEPVSKPIPVIEIVNSDGGTYVMIKKINEKHVNGQGEMAVIDLVLPIFDEWEQLMWNFITDGGLNMQIDQIFKFNQWKSLSKSNLSHIIKNNFTTSLKDNEDIVHRNSGITPHILRHMRAYNVLINHNVPNSLAIKWFGWSDEQMLYYYAHIQRMMGIQDQIKMIRSNGLLTSLKINYGDLIIK